MNKWIKAGWGDDQSDIFDQTLPYTISFNADITNIPALEAAINCVNEICNSYPAPYSLMVSGGVDSQAMLWAWMQSGREFTAYSVEYISENIHYNKADQEELRTFALMYHIPIVYKRFDVLKFLEGDCYSYQCKYKTTSPQIATHIAMSENIKGTRIFSGNFFYTVDSVPFDFSILGLARYAETSNVVPFFFCHTQELALAFLRRDHTGYDTKCIMFKEAGFPVLNQPFKMTGFEQIKEYYDGKTELVTSRDRLRFARKPSKRIFDLAFRYSVSTSIPYIDKIKIL